MAFHVHVNAYISGLAHKLNDLSEAEHEIAVLAKDLADPYVPKKTGALARSARVDGNIVSYNTVYAHRQYVTRDTEEYPWKHENGQAFWFWGMQKDNAAVLRRAAAEAVLKEMRRSKW